MKRGRRSKKGLVPRNVGIPKFFSPTDLKNLKRIRKINPHLSWEEKGWEHGIWIKDELLDWANENL